LTSRGAGLAWFVAGGFLYSAGIVAYNVIVGTFRATYCPPGLLGRVTACSRFANYGAVPIGALIGGVLGTVLGVREAVWIAAAACALTTLVLLAGPLRRQRDLPTEPAGALFEPAGS
jgi:MFS family permease